MALGSTALKHAWATRSVAARLLGLACVAGPLSGLTLMLQRPSAIRTDALHCGISRQARLQACASGIGNETSSLPSRSRPGGRQKEGEEAAERGSGKLSERNRVMAEGWKDEVRGVARGSCPSTAYGFKCELRAYSSTGASRK